MPDEPYRTPDVQPAPDDDELARLAAEGQRKIQAATHRREAAHEIAADKTRDAIIRSALGAHYGSPARRTARGAAVVVALCIVGAIGASPRKSAS